jgi:hypothetical protein
LSRLLDPIAHGHRHADGTLGRIFHLRRIVEKDHAGAGESLERSACSSRM